jgi:hypothetical protein
VASVGAWEVAHVEGRQYVLTHVLDYDASRVSIQAQSRTTGKPDPNSGAEIVWERKIEVVRRGKPFEADPEAGRRRH